MKIIGVIRGIDCNTPELRGMLGVHEAGYPVITEIRTLVRLEPQGHPDLSPLIRGLKGPFKGRNLTSLHVDIEIEV